jgi:hypothetical protein
VTCQGQKKKGKPSKYNQIYLTHTHTKEKEKKKKEEEEEEVVEISPKVLIKIIIISP